MHRRSAGVSSSSDDGSSFDGSSSSFPKGSCVVTESDASEIHIILVAARYAPKARVVRVCPTSGALLRVQRPRGWGNDDEEESVFFASDLDALTYLKELGKVKNATRGTCVLGIARLGDQVAALVATKVQKAMRLPTGEDVFRICETKWIKTTSISSPVRLLTEQEKEHARALMDFPIDGLHFYSETFDLRKSLAFRDSSRSSSLASPPPKEEAKPGMKLVEKTYVDPNGYFCTQQVWVKDESAATKMEISAPKAKPAAPKPKGLPKPKPAPKKKLKKGQTSLSSFFAKK